MVRLDRIYTRSGDDGTTALGDGSRRGKHDPRVAAYGTVDELSSVLGLLLADGLAEPHAAHVLEIQNDLFDVGADLCTPGQREGALRVTPGYTARIEELIDSLNADLAPLRSFVLPGGTKPSAWLHLARTVCRRAERLVTETIEAETRGSQGPQGAQGSKVEHGAEQGAPPAELEPVNLEVVRYLNRLSDLLFVLGRALNEGGAKDVLWRPGLRQGGREG